MEDVNDLMVANKFEINKGGKIRIPGLEPTTDLTSPTLANTLGHHNPEISADRALQLIPGSSIEVSPFDPTIRYFVFPSGPPPDGNECPTRCPEDWYMMLRDEAAQEPIQPEEPECASLYNFGWCPDPELKDMPQ